MGRQLDERESISRLHGDEIQSDDATEGMENKEESLS